MLGFHLTAGVNPGYDHDNYEKDPLGVGLRVWNQAARYVQGMCGFFVSASVAHQKVVHENFPEGEDVVVFTGFFDPTKVTNADVWANAVGRVASKVGELLNQDRVHLQFLRVVATMALHQHGGDVAGLPARLNIIP